MCLSEFECTKRLKAHSQATLLKYCSLTLSHQNFGSHIVSENRNTSLNQLCMPVQCVNTAEFYETSLANLRDINTSKNMAAENVKKYVLIS